MLWKMPTCPDKNENLTVYIISFERPYLSYSLKFYVFLPFGFWYKQCEMDKLCQNEICEFVGIKMSLDNDLDNIEW